MVTPDDHDVTWRRAPAASRVVGEERFVCRAGWDTEVQRLGGAARIVWEIVGESATTSTIARVVGVEADDPYLHEALTLLAGSGLIERVEE
jgi:hypothetical protein